MRKLGSLSGGGCALINWREAKEEKEKMEPSLGDLADPEEVRGDGLPLLSPYALCVLLGAPLPPVPNTL